MDSSINKKRIRYYYNLIGLIQMEQGRLALAVESLQKSLDDLYYPHQDFPAIHSFFYLALAEAQFAAEQWESARISCEKVFGASFYPF